MFAWIADNYAALIVYILLALVIGGALFAVIRRRKKGGSCGCGCSGCPYSGSCRDKNNDNKGNY